MIDADDDGYGRKEEEEDERMGINTTMPLARLVVREAVLTTDGGRHAFVESRGQRKFGRQVLLPCRSYIFPSHNEGGPFSACAAPLL